MSRALSESLDAVEASCMRYEHVLPLVMQTEPAPIGRVSLVADLEAARKPPGNTMSEEAPTRILNTDSPVHGLGLAMSARSETPTTIEHQKPQTLLGGSATISAGVALPVLTSPSRLPVGLPTRDPTNLATDKPSFSSELPRGSLWSWFKAKFRIGAAQ